MLLMVITAVLQPATSEEIETSEVRVLRCRFEDHWKMRMPDLSYAVYYLRIRVMNVMAILRQQRFGVTR